MSTRSSGRSLRIVSSLERDTVEIAHDVLLHTWAELTAWLNRDRVDGALYSQIITDAKAWQRHGDDPCTCTVPGAWWRSAKPGSAGHVIPTVSEAADH